MADAKGIRIRGDGGEVVREILREPLEWARHRATDLPFSLSGPVCRAPSSSLRLTDAGRRATVCRLAGTPVGTGDSIDAVWNGTQRLALAAAHQDGALPSSHCARCIRDLDAKLWHATEIIRDHSPRHDPEVDPPTEGEGALRELTCVVTPDCSPDEWRAVLSTSLPPIVVIEATDPDACPAVDAILQAIEEQAIDEQAIDKHRDRTVRIELRATRLPTVPEAARSRLVDNARIERIHLRWSEDYEANLRRAAALAPAAELRLEVGYGPSNWFDLREIAETSARLDTTVDLRLDRDSVLALPLVEQRFLVGVAADNWEPFSGDARPSSLSATAYDDLLLELNSTVRMAARDAVHGDPQGALSGRAEAGLVWPMVDHDALRERDRALRLTNRVLDLAGSPSVHAWIDAAVLDEDRGLDPRDERMPWLSLLVQSIAIHCASDAAAEWLRTRFDDPARADRLLAAEHEFAKAGGYEGWPEYFHEHLGLTRLSRRAPPFDFAPAQLPQAPTDVDVTVLVPSYRHEEFIVDTLCSVLAQTYPNFRLLVVDDRSDDATVARARSLSDPRLEVRTNATNLGLGNSVREALADCDTPFVALLNSDDIFHPDRLARCRQALLDNPSAQLVATDLHLIDSDGGALHAGNASRLRDGAKVFDWVGWFGDAQPGQIDPEHLFGDLLASNFLATSTNLFCRTDFLREQTDALESLKYCLDWQLCLEAARTTSLLYLPEKLAGYRLHRSNTVWFREGRRWTYYLEVNRVVASTLSRFLADAKTKQAAKRRLATLSLVARQLVSNTEVDGYGLFLNRLLGGVALEELSQGDDARALVQTLHERAERSLRVHHAVQDQLLEDSHTDLLRRVPSLEVANLLAEIVTDELVSTRGRIDQLDLRVMQAEQAAREIGHDRDAAARAFRHYHDAFDTLAEALAAHDEEAQSLLDRPVASDAPLAEQVRCELPRLHQLEWRLRRDLEAMHRLGDVRDRLEGELQDSRQETVSVRERLGSRVQEQAQRITELAERIAALGRERKQTRVEFEDRRAEAERGRAKAERQLAAAEQRGANIEQRRADLRTKLDRVRVEFEATRTRLVAAQTTLGQTTAELNHKRKESQRLADQRSRLQVELEAQSEELQLTKDNWRAELEALHLSREWRLGNLLWGKIPGLRKVARLVGRADRRLRDRRSRGLFQAAQRELDPGKLNIVVAATADFPVYSHTFVYQELLAMHEQLEANVQTFYRFDSTDVTLPEAFRYLDRHKARIDATHGTFCADLARFRRRYPDRLATLLRAIEGATGRDPQDLLVDDDLLGAFTFARRVETVRPDYLHTYFFYEQSLGALVAQWLLDVPRGVSAYADHMLSDWPFKLVALHLQTAEIVVATSNRIRDELCTLAGSDEHAHKILVKPNGVDGERFPFTERPDRASDRPLELLSVSRIERKKGLLELVEAVAALRDRHGLAVRVHVVGTVAPVTPSNVAYGEAFERAIRLHGLEQSFRRHGFLDHAGLLPLLERSHAFVAPYVETRDGDKDGIPTAVLEAMSAGLPVLASDAGSLPEVVATGVEGWVIPRADPEALIEALRELHGESTAELRAAGRRARDRFEQDFDARVTEPRLHERIREATAGGGERSR